METSAAGFQWLFRIERIAETYRSRRKLLVRTKQELEYRLEGQHLLPYLPDPEIVYKGIRALLEDRIPRQWCRAHRHWPLAAQQAALRRECPMSRMPESGTSGSVGAAGEQSPAANQRS